MVTEKKSNKQGFTGSQVGAVNSINRANASDTAIEWSSLIREEAKRLMNVDSDISQGFLFEYIEATKFNIDAAVKGSNLKAEVTAASGDHHNAADILIKEGKKVVKEVQAKSSDNAVDATGYFKNSKYDGMQKLTNPEHSNRVKELAENRASQDGIYAKEYADTAKNATGKLHHDNINSGGTSHSEAVEAAENASEYTNRMEIKTFSKEIGVTAVNVAAASAVVSGIFSGVHNYREVMIGNIDTNEAVKKTVKDSAKAGFRGGVTGAGGAGIRIAASKVGVKTLAKSNVAMSVAAGTVETGVIIYKYAKGEISTEQAMELVGQNTVSTASGIFAGAAAGMVFGPAGAAVGSIIGYIAASNLHQSCMAIYGQAKLAEEEAQRVVAVYEAASKEIDKQRKTIEKHAREIISKNDRVFKQCFASIDNGLNTKNPQTVIEGLTNLTCYLGRKLKLSKFEDFDEFMSRETDDPLLL